MHAIQRLDHNSHFDDSVSLVIIINIYSSIYNLDQVVQLLLRHKSDVNFVNEHGNSAMHYACFWGFTDIAEELVDAGALVAVQNKYQVPDLLVFL